MSDHFAFGMAQGVLAKIDIFGTDLPGFKLKGKAQVYTACGGLLTTCISIVLLLFASLKFIHLVDHYNPNVSQIQQQAYFTEEDVFNAREENFRVAFSLEGYSDKKSKLDPRYVKSFVRIFSSFEGKETYKEIASHPCTEADFDEFYPVNKHSAY